MMSSAEVVRRIMTAQAPVLLLDTRSLLDLMRDPTRETFTAEQVQAAHHLLVKAESRPPKLWIPIAGQVLAERHEHQLNVKQEAETAIHPDLVAEFHAVNMAYAVNFPMAKHLLA
jgi:hypothetical protein